MVLNLWLKFMYFFLGWYREKNWKWSYLLIKISLTSFQVIFWRFHYLIYMRLKFNLLHCTFLRLKFWFVNFSLKKKCGTQFPAEIWFFFRRWNRGKALECWYLLIKSSQSSFEVIFGGSIFWIFFPLQFDFFHAILYEIKIGLSK